jgi:hypothetical protein
MQECVLFPRIRYHTVSRLLLFTQSFCPEPRLEFRVCGDAAEKAGEDHLSAFDGEWAGPTRRAWGVDLCEINVCEE